MVLSAAMAEAAVNIKAAVKKMNFIGCRAFPNLVAFAPPKPVDRGKLREVCRSDKRRVRWAVPIPRI